MKAPAPTLGIWLVVGLLMMLVVVPLWRPLRGAWRCYELHRDGFHARGEILHKLDESRLAVRLSGAPDGMEACTVAVSTSYHAAVEIGTALDVVAVPGRPGECELLETVEASGIALWSITGGVVSLNLLFVALGAKVQQSSRRRMGGGSKARRPYS